MDSRAPAPKPKAPKRREAPWQPMGPMGISGTWVKQCHLNIFEPSPSHHHFYRVYIDVYIYIYKPFPVMGGANDIVLPTLHITFNSSSPVRIVWRTATSAGTSAGTSATSATSAGTSAGTDECMRAVQRMMDIDRGPTCGRMVPVVPCFRNHKHNSHWKCNKRCVSKLIFEVGHLDNGRLNCVIFCLGFRCFSCLESINI